MAPTSPIANHGRRCHRRRRNPLHRGGPGGGGVPQVAADARQVLVVLLQEHLEEALRRDQAEEASVAVDAAAQARRVATACHAACSWSVPGATTGGRVSMTSPTAASTGAASSRSIVDQAGRAGPVGTYRDHGGAREGPAA